MTVDIHEFLKRFDHRGPELAEDPWAVYAVMRKECPVLHTDAHGGYWAITRYQDVCDIARDDELWSSSRNGIIIPEGPVGAVPIEIDPPEVFKYRSLINPLMSPATVRQMEPRIRALARELIDEVIESGACDIHRALARPLPAILTFRLLGLPTDNWHVLVDRLEYAAARPREEVAAGAASTGNRFASEFADQVQQAIAERIKEPREDWLSFLLQAKIDGEPLRPDRFKGYVDIILAGGLLTTTDAIGNAIIYLGRDREARQRLINEPDLWDSAIEEFLRYEAPTTALARTATRDTVVGGQTIREGERVMIFWASANRDEAEFPEPDRVILDRHPNRHVTFGVGAHRCIGSNLARIEFRAALEEVLRRMPDYEVDEGGIEPSNDVGVTYGRVAIPIRFTPGRRER